jgi:hypothetical protein
MKRKRHMVVMTIRANTANVYGSMLPLDAFYPEAGYI